MSRYTKYETTLDKFYAQESTSKDLPLQISRTVYQEFILKKDKTRTCFISLDGRPISSLQKTLFNADRYDRQLRYTQGDYEATNALVFLKATETFQNNTMSRGLNGSKKKYLDEIHFAYLNDNNIPCGLNITKIDENPIQYAITLIQNTIVPEKDRRIIIVCDNTLFQTIPFVKGFDHAQTQAVKEPQTLMQSIQNDIRSEKIVQLLSELLDDNGDISPTKFDALSSRIKGNRNIDDRDVRQQQFEKWLRLVKAIDPETANKAKQRSEEEVNFFENTNFETLLFDLTAIVPLKRPQAILLQLEYLISNINTQEQDYTETFEQTRDKQINNLWDTLKEKTPTIESIYSFDSFKQHALQTYRKKEFSMLVNKLSLYIDECPQYYGAHEARRILKACQKLDFDNLNTQGQEAVFALVNAWIGFKGSNAKPEDYDHLMTLYDTFGFKHPDRGLVMETPEAAYLTHIYKQKRPPQVAFDPQACIVYDTYDHKRYRITVVETLNKDDPLYKRYIAKIKKALENIKPKPSQENVTAILDSLQSLQTENNIVPLQQILHVYLGTLARSFQQHSALNEHSCDQAFNDTMNKVSKEVMNTFAQALLRSHKANKLSPNEINKTLQAAIAPLKIRAKKILFEKLSTIQPSIAQHTEPMPFLRDPSNPVLHINRSLQQATWIDSRHADLLVHRNAQIYDFDPKQNRISGRAPHRQVFIPASTGDHLLKKINYLSLFYSVEQSLSYHLFTTPKQSTDEDVKKTLLSIHTFNRQIYSRPYAVRSSDNPLCFLQATGLKPLGYTLFDWSGLRNETSLMTEMALVNNLEKGKFKWTAYESFLKDPHKTRLEEWFNSPLLSQNTYGREIKRSIQQQKKKWQKETLQPTIEYAPKDLVSHALKKLFAFDLHFNPHYATLTQALSLSNEINSFISDETQQDQAIKSVSYAKFFELNPPDKALMTNLKLLAEATNKKTSETAAKAVMTRVQQLSTLHPNSAEKLMAVMDESYLEGKTIAPKLSAKKTSKSSFRHISRILNMDRSEQIHPIIQPDSSEISEQDQVAVNQNTLNPRHHEDEEEKHNEQQDGPPYNPKGT